MTGEKLLEIAEQKGFLDQKTIAKLRKQLTSTDRDVSAQRVAKLLVKRGMLTKFQAKTLLDAAQQAEPETAAKPPQPAADSTPELAPIDSSPELAPIDSSPELTPIDSSAELTPLDSSAELLPLDSSAELTPVDSALLEPVPEPAPRGSSQVDADEVPVTDLELDAHDPLGHDDVAWDSHHAEEDAESEGDLEARGGAATKVGKGKSKRGLAGLLGGGKKSRGGGKRTAKGWDSPLMLVGGGTLIVLVCLVVFLYFFLQRGSGDELFDIAEEEYRGQSYTQAINSYGKFLDNFPDHPKASLARVRQGMARLRQTVDSAQNWDAALETANAQLPAIKTEEAFDEARPELGNLLTNIYAGFVTLAEETEEAGQKVAMLDKAEQALALVNNPEYLPSSIRGGQQPKIDEVQDRIALIQRDINRDQELAQAIEQIQQATAQREIARAYDVRRELLAKYPGLQTNAQLREVVQAITQAEKEKVVAAEATLTPLTQAREGGVARRVVLADHESSAATGLDELAVVTVLVDGAAYGLAAHDGRVLWRHWLGYASRVQPVPSSDAADADPILVDTRHNELLRLAARTGEIVWRLPVGETMTAPIVLDKLLFVSTDKGNVLSVNVDSGQAVRHAQLPQTNLGPLGLDRDHRYVYAIGQHSSLYVLSADTLECQEVLYVGHKRDSVAVPPELVGGYLFVVENGGSGAAVMHVYRAEENGLILQPARDPERLDGNVFVPMLVFGRRMLVSNDRGGMVVFDVDPANAAEPVRALAKTLPSAGDRFVQYAVEDNGQVFVAGRQLARYELQASRGQLARKWAGIEGDVFTGPMHLQRDVLMHVRRRKGQVASTVEATRVSLGRQIAQEGASLWVTELAAPPAMEVQFDRQRRSLVALSATGKLWDIGANAMSSGVLEEVAVRVNPAALSGPLTHAVPLPDQRVALLTEPPSSQAVLYDPAGAQRMREWTLPIADAQLSCPPVAVGANLLVCTTGGPVRLIDVAAGREAVLPFQPKLSADTRLQWLRPAVVDPQRPVVVTAEQAGLLYVLGVDAQPEPHLTTLATRQLSGQLAAQLATIGTQLIVVQRDGAQDKVMALVLPQMEQEQVLDVGGQVVAGPLRLGELVLLVTNQDELVAIDASGQIVWKSPMPYGPLAGEPLLEGGRLVLAAAAGRVWQVDAATGAALPWNTAGASTEALDVGEPLSGQAVILGSRLFLLGRDSTLYITDVPPVAAGSVGRRP